MEIKTVIQILKKLPGDVGLDDPSEWDDSDEVQAWRRDALEALKLATKVMDSGKVVGTLNLEGKEYKIVQ